MPRRSLIRALLACTAIVVFAPTFAAADTPVHVRVIKGSRNGPARIAPELEPLKRQLSSLAYVRWLGEFASMGDWRLFFLYRERVRRVTVADVQRVLDAYSQGP